MVNVVVLMSLMTDPDRRIVQPYAVYLSARGTGQTIQGVLPKNRDLEL